MKYIKHTSPLSDIKTWLALIAIIVITPILINNYLGHKNPGLLIALILIPVFFLFNLTIRKSIAYKNYFTSKLNILTSKFYYEKAFDIEKELMFEKLIEVINNSEFKLVEINQEKSEILAITKTSWKSWGENLYINFETAGENTNLKFCSVTLFQIISWGKNENNIVDLLNEIESSFTI